jgi:hypothetical protein
MPLNEYGLMGLFAFSITFAVLFIVACKVIVWMDERTQK